MHPDHTNREMHSVVAVRGSSAVAPLARTTGTVLLEVLLALSLLFVSAAVVFSGLSASFTAVAHMRLRAQAVDLAISKLSEIEMRQLDPVDDGPNPYQEEDLAEWTWELATSATEGLSLHVTPMQRIEIIVRHTETGIAQRLGILTSQQEEFLAAAQANPSPEPLR